MKRIKKFTSIIEEKKEQIPDKDLKIMLSKNDIINENNSDICREVDEAEYRTFRSMYNTSNMSLDEKNWIWNLAEMLKDEWGLDQKIYCQHYPNDTTAWWLVKQKEDLKADNIFLLCIQIVSGKWSRWHGHMEIYITRYQDDWYTVKFIDHLKKMTRYICDEWTSVTHLVHSIKENIVR